MSQENLIEELQKFSPKITDFGEPLATDIIIDFELSNNVNLPADYKRILLTFNGFNIMGSEVYGIGFNPQRPSLNSVYEIEHYRVAFPQPSYCVPFSPDGGGNFYCFDTRYLTNEGDSCPIVFWVSNFEYSTNNQPEIVYNGFIEFVEEVIVNWTLEDYDHDGKERE